VADHHQQQSGGEPPSPFPLPELDDSEGRSPRRLEIHNQESGFRINRRILRSIALEALRQEDQAYREVDLVLLSPEEMRRYNRDFHQQDESTDHLGFQYEAPDGEVSGDVFVCPAVCAEQAASFGETERRELARVVIHGMLHLCGWSDDTPARRGAMRRRENQLLESCDTRPTLSAWMKGGRL
jgi:probable rRNA maturation factor